MLSREEYIEQAYFFRTLRERLGENLPAQEILTQIHEELLSTTRLPLEPHVKPSERHNKTNSHHSGARACRN